MWTARQSFSDEEIFKLAQVIGVPEPTIELTTQLQAAAEGYFFASMVDRDPKRAEKRNSLKRIAKLSKELHDAFGKLDAHTVHFISGPLIPDLSLLPVLQARIENALSKIPRKGGESKQARKIFVRDLAEIWCEVKGGPPTRRVSVSDDPRRDHREYGPFFDFVNLALEFIDPPAVTGVSNDIKHVIQAMGKNTG